ncbi:hypothetical protein D7D81_13115 [Halocella sp. SP3-1]|nr:hypothetical protein D7D81_13115 [Halocella sp. SP3-1]
MKNGSDLDLLALSFQIISHRIKHVIYGIVTENFTMKRAGIEPTLMKWLSHFSSEFQRPISRLMPRSRATNEDDSKYFRNGYMFKIYKAEYSRYAKEWLPFGT